MNNSTFHQRTKHIDVRLFYNRELQEKKTINIVYINTEQQLADILTKPLAVARFEKLRDALGVVPIKNLELNISNQIKAQIRLKNSQLVVFSKPVVFKKESKYSFKTDTIDCCWNEPKKIEPDPRVSFLCQA